jgi:Zn finger protein HypA/HybF involved in hydrogenase expression
MKIELLKHAGRIAGYNLVPENPAETGALKAISDELGNAKEHPEDAFGFYYAGIMNGSPQFIHKGFETHDIKTLTKLGEITVAEVEEEADEYLVCSECGSKNVQVTAWVNANTNRYTGDTDDDEAWCEDCDEHVTLDLIKRKARKGKKNG